jgi:MarR family transcriptional regulator, temperature-dependent positive regulator of motility
MSTRKTKSAAKAPQKTVSAKTVPSAKKTVAPINNHSPAHLIHRAEQCAADIFARLAPAGQLTPRQLTILAAIEADPGISQTGLVEKTGIDRSTLADIIRRMLEKDLLQRQRTAEDARAYAVKLTRKGTNLLKKMQPYAEQVDRELLKAIPKERKDVFLAVLAQMVASLTERDDETQ